MEEEEEEGEEEAREESIYSRGVPGWDKVECLARALMKICCLSVSTTQGQEIKDLHEDI